ncbi:hypothetical protein ACOMHN_048769 [Nucella lapillus]
MELGILHNSPPSTKRGCRAGRLHRLWHGLPPAPWPCTRSQHHSVPSRNLHQLMVPPFLQPHPDLQSAVGNARLSSKHPAQLPTTDCLLSIISPMGGQPSDAPALSPPSLLQQGSQSSNAPALSPPSPLPQGGQPIALALSPPSPPPQGGQPSDAPGLSPSSSTLLLCPSDSTLNICHLNSQSAVKTAVRKRKQKSNNNNNNNNMATMSLSKLLAAAIMMTSSASFSVAGERIDYDDLPWEPNKVKETVTMEATLDIVVKNYDDSGDMHGTLKIGLFGDKVPMTVLNFVSLCNGVKRPQGELKYGGSLCHKLITDMHIQCGDITTGDGSGGTSIFGEKFDDENFEIGLSETGTIAMCNRGVHTNGSQFFIIFRSMQSLDGRHVAFGQIVEKTSLEFLRKLNELPTDTVTFAPKRKIKLVHCSAITLKKPLIITRRVAAQHDKF